MRTLMLMAAFLSSFGRLFGGDETPSYKTVAIFDDLRGHLLTRLFYSSGPLELAVLKKIGFTEVVL